jgi:hypothetical protein
MGELAERGRPGLLVGLQPRDHVGKILPADDEVLRAAGEHQPATRRLRRRRHALGGMLDGIERIVPAPG